jgi:copper homeostasis protein
MQADILQCKELDMDGIVTGILTKDREIDAKRMQVLMELAYPLPVTFHRAIDLTNDPLASIEQLISLGCTSMLSSGASSSAIEGIGNLRNWQMQFSGQIEIIAGGGINPDNIAKIANHTNLRAYHTSLRKPGNPLKEQFGSYEPILSSDVKKLKFALHQSLLE